MRINCLALFLGLVLSFEVRAAEETRLESSQGRLIVNQMAEGFDIPWAFAFLPDGGVLVTEREGELYHLKDGRRTQIAGTPPVVARGQGGLMDVMVPRDFDQSREIFLTFSKKQGRGANTALARGVLNPSGDRLTEVKILFEAAEGGTGGRHFGSRG